MSRERKRSERIRERKERKSNNERDEREREVTWKRVIRNKLQRRNEAKRGVKGKREKKYQTWMKKKVTIEVMRENEEWEG